MLSKFGQRNKNLINLKTKYGFKRERGMRDRQNSMNESTTRKNFCRIVFW